MLLTEDKLRDIIKEIINRTLNEATWNYHYGKNHNGKPYMSDNKYEMMGRDTGHFGSGTYFSTYSFKTDNNPNDKYTNNSTPEFIQIDDNVYRVDIDLYKNLYRVYNNKQGYVLFSLLKTLNSMYGNVTYKNFDNSQHYQKAKRNAEALNLNIPSYRELMKMMQKHHNSNNIQSFSTVFMEYNGYNGVNVSNVPEFDNTIHGSVIYDLSKTNSSVEQVKPNSLLFHKGNRTNMVVSKPSYEDDDMEINSMYGDINMSYIDKLNSLPKNRAMRILKNNVANNRLINSYLLYNLNEDIASHFLYYIYYNRNKYNNLIKTYWLDSYKDEEYFMKTINKTKAYYWVNYNDEIILSLIEDYKYNLPYNISKEEEKRKIHNFINNILKVKENISPNLQKEINDYID